MVASFHELDVNVLMNKNIYLTDEEFSENKI